MSLVEVATSKGCEYLDEEDEREDVKRKRLKEEAAAGGGVDAAAGASQGTGGVQSANNTGGPPVSNAAVGTGNAGAEQQKEKGVFSACGNLFLCLAYAPHDLTGLMDMSYKFTAVQTKYIFRQLLSALTHLHGKGYIHRDLKCSNILLTADFTVKLADFGLARNVTRQKDPWNSQAAPAGNDAVKKCRDRDTSGNFTNKVITLWYRPPELLLGAQKYGEKVDMWSAGCIFAEVQTGKPILPGKGEVEQVQLIFDLCGTPSTETMEGYRLSRGGKQCDVKVGRTRQKTIRER